MSVNQLFLCILLVSAIGSLGLHIASIKWGLNWANITNISFVKAFGLLVLFVLAESLAAAVVGVVLVSANVNLTSMVEGVVGIGLQFVAACFVVVLIYKVRAGRAAKAVVPMVFVSLGLTLIAIFVIRPIAYEAYVIPTNGMAPTLLGEYLEAPCPRCGSPAYGSPPDARRPLPPEGLQMICSKELRSVFVKDPPQVRHDGDRLLACKLLTPKRWDLIVFRYPHDPSVNYVKRLVGLPGEKLAIRDGTLWINGERLEPPAPISGIHYSPTIEIHGRIFSGPGSVPVELGPDEYFVLGDFVDASSDSRFWEQGAPGHPPYAVPASHIIGVVINVYWPPSRWTSFR